MTLSSQLDIRMGPSLTFPEVNTKSRPASRPPTTAGPAQPGGLNSDRTRGHTAAVMVERCPRRLITLIFAD